VLFEKTLGQAGGGDSAKDASTGGRGGGAWEKK